MSKQDTQFKKGQPSWNKGKKLSNEAKQKLRDINLGKKHSEETRKKMSKSGKGRKHSEEAKRKIREKRALQIFTPEAKQKMRESRIKYILNVSGNIYPCIGHNEKQILDKLEEELGYRIIRQFEVGGYFLDGYIPEINLSIEVDEKYHENQKEKDLEREEFIIAKLGCRFMRIKDYNK